MIPNLSASAPRAARAGASPKDAGRPSRRGTLASLCLLGLPAAGCITRPRTRFTAEEARNARPPGFGQVFYRHDDPALPQMLDQTLQPGADGFVDALAISGGGANGAFGAGILAGWAKSGQRPQFQAVSGISSGALTAPFAFLGPRWDGVLRDAYLGPDAQHVLQGRGLMILFTPGVYSKAPLQQIVDRYVTDDLIAAIAAERAKGRLLLVATTNLDADELLVWDMGAIASRGGPRARRLFIQVLIASSSIPVGFAPTMIKMQSGARTFSEMHVDGGDESAFFAVPEALLLGRPNPTGPNVRLYIIVNENLSAPFSVTSYNTLAIGQRALIIASKAHLRSSLIATFQYYRGRGHEFRVASLPKTVKDAPFDFRAKHLQALYDAGEALAAAGQAWRTDPLP